jgi:hypothetical protein
MSKIETYQAGVGYFDELQGKSVTDGYHLIDGAYYFQRGYVAGSEPELVFPPTPKEDLIKGCRSVVFPDGDIARPGIWPGRFALASHLVGLERASENAVINAVWEDVDYASEVMVKLEFNQKKGEA